MALPASGPLALTDIQTEFGGANPIGMNEYYAGGGLVPAGTSGTYGAVPSSGALSIQNFYGTSNFVPVYIEDIFSTWLYTGNGTSQTITNGINVSGSGGLVWVKGRDGSAAPDHLLFDTNRGATVALITNETIGNYTNANTLTAFTSSGFSVGNYVYINNPSGSFGSTYASWTFRKQPKFFDVVTYTGDGVSGRAISHSLGATPGLVIVKRTDDSGAWKTFWNSVGAVLNLNSTSGTQGGFGSGYVGAVSSTTFSVYQSTNSATITDVNASGSTYVAYLFASNAGGFGAAGTDNIITCGNFTADGSGNATISLGYEPQWLMVKNVSNASAWWMQDVMRGLPANNGGNGRAVRANSSSTEEALGQYNVTSTGFVAQSQAGGDLYVYMAIRRGPMKVPTVGTSVFTPTATSASTGTTITTNITSDMHWAQYLDGDGQNTTMFDRLRGISSVSGTYSTNYKLVSSSTDVEATGSSGSPAWVSGFTNTGWVQGSYAAGAPGARYDFRRAPSFFDVVCASGPSTTNHNLGVLPELVFFKTRNSNAPWDTVCSGLTGGVNGNYYLDLNNTNAQISNSVPILPVTSTTINPSVLVASGTTWVAYLFATCAGVSKVGSYTGTAALQTVNCGFTTGARFVLIKRIDSTGDWYVWDSARGITSGNDPYFIMNVGTNAQVTGTNYVDTTSVGFQVTAAAPAGLNASGGTYIFLAIA